MSEQTPLDAVEFKLQSLRSERERIDREIKALEGAAEILRPAYQDLPAAPLLSGALIVGVTEGVRSVLQASEDFLVPTAIRDGMKRTGLLKDYPNEMAVIHQIIRRLDERGQLDKQDTPNGKAYRWRNQGAVGPPSYTLKELAGVRYGSGGKVTLKYPRKK
jgi:hypothetical protein